MTQLNMKFLEEVGLSSTGAHYKLEWVQLRSLRLWSCEERLGELCLFSLGQTQLWGHLATVPSTYRGIIEGTEMDLVFSWECWARGWEMVVRSWNKRFSIDARENFFCVRTVKRWHRSPRDVQSPVVGFWLSWMNLCAAWPDLRADPAVRRSDQRPFDVFPSQGDAVTLWMPSVDWSVLPVLVKTDMQCETQWKWGWFWLWLLKGTPNSILVPL